MRRAEAFDQLLRAAFDDALIEIEDQSHHHAGHYDDAIESHFLITVTSRHFIGKNTLQRQRMALQAVSSVTGWHALSWRLKVPEYKDTH